MPTLLGPSHYLFYAALHRRRLWLAHLSRAFDEIAAPPWRESKHKLDSKFGRMFARLSTAEHLGIQASLPLQTVIDDTPIDSFLMTLSDDLNAYEQKLLGLMRQYAGTNAWLEPLGKVSALWGRGLAQECILTSRAGIQHESHIPVRALFELIQSVLQGGDFAWKPLLLRRCTNRELKYELRRCPHRRPDASPAVADACRLEAMVYRGFIQALLPDSSYERLYKVSYCVDELHLGKAPGTR